MTVQEFHEKKIEKDELVKQFLIDVSEWKEDYSSTNLKIRAKRLLNYI